MTYTIRSKDGTQAVYKDKTSGRLYARDVSAVENGEIAIYQTNDKDMAVMVWQSVGGDYGDFEVVEE